MLLAEASQLSLSSLSLSAMSIEKKERKKKQKKGRERVRQTQTADQRATCNVCVQRAKSRLTNHESVEVLSGKQKDLSPSELNLSFVTLDGKKHVCDRETKRERLLPSPCSWS